MDPPVYLPMLAALGAGKLQGEWVAEPKLDGWRAIHGRPSLPSGFGAPARPFLTTLVPYCSASLISTFGWCATANLSR